MNTLVRSLGLISLAGGILGSTAAPALADSPTSPTRTLVAADAGDGHKLLTSIRFGDRTEIEFIKGDDGSIGMVETSPVGAPSYLTDLTGRQKGTALEVFLALAPDKAPPVELKQAHELSVRAAGRSELAPLKLVAPTTPQATATESYIPGQCDYDTDYKPGDSQFTWGWYWGLGSTKDFTGQQTYFPSHLNGTGGKYWYAGVSQQRWLAACNGNVIFGFNNFYFRAQYRGTDGAWHTSYTKQVAPDFKVVYSSQFGATRWRVKLSEISFNVFLNREYGVAVAGNEPIDDFKIGN